MPKYRVDYVFYASFSTYTEAENEDQALDQADEGFSPYSDESLATVEFSLRPVSVEVEEDDEF